jgi:DNA-binding beta-propeller fold protein YncE
VSPTAIAAVLIVACLGMGMVMSVPYRFFRRRQRKAERYITRACAAVMAGIALAAVGVTAASASAATPRALQAAVTGGGTALAATSPGTQLWVERYNADNGIDDASSVAVSPNGKTVFVTGHSYGGAVSEVYGYATMAYNAVTGARLWVSRYDDPSSGGDEATSVAVSPDGTMVYVTGTSEGTAGYDYATVAYNAATGAQRWVDRYGDGDVYGAPSVSVSPNGNSVFLTGSISVATTGSDDYATVGYSAVTGTQQWVKLYKGPSGGNFAHSAAVSPNGSTVFVTGTSLGTNNGYDYATVAYNAVTGAQQWAARYNGATEGDRGANSIAVSPNGKTVFVTGSSDGGTATGYDYATVAYNATTGNQLWAKRYNGSGNSDDQAYSVAVSPTGTTVYVTGYSDTNTVSSGFEYTTIAYAAADGDQLWLSSYNGPAKSTSEAYSATVSPDGTTVYVTGYSYGCICGGEDYATVAYNAATGAQQWAQRYHGSGPNASVAQAVAVSPTTGTVYVTGYSDGSGTGYDYATIAYQG